MSAGDVSGSPATGRRKKIAILGGGIAGLTTALHLSETQALRERYDITVFQMGWRLGGKCATGRGPAGRVQEHGIHLFGGGYYNALDLMRAVYDELHHPGGPGWPVRFETAFEPQSVSLTPKPGGVAVMSFARNGLRHGRDAAPATVRQWLWRGAVNLARTGLQGLRAGGNLTLDRTALAYMRVIVWGLFKDRLWRRRTFGELDREPYDAWLKRHGASDAVIDSPLAQAPLRLLYQYPGGDAAAHPRGDMGAGAYLQWVLRTVAYLGAPFWFFQEGTGESVIQPLYELLRRRGVRFEFFHRVEELVPDAGGTALAEVRMQVQATTLGGQPYDPLQRSGPLGTWPDRPLYGQLVQGGALAALPPGELEDTWSTWPGAGMKVLRVRTAGQAGGGDDDALAVDQVVLAISLGALPRICAPLIAAHPRWAQMVARLPTVETHTLQLWLSEPSHKLTVDKLHARNDDEDTGLGCGLAHPFDGFSDFTPLIAYEHWPAGSAPKSLWYFSDVLAGSPPHAQAQAPGYEAQRQAAALQASRAFVDGALLQGLFTQPAAAKPAPGKGFNDALLVAPPGAPPAPGADPLTAQWARAHVQPSERYVQAPAGSADARLEAGASGFAGLVLAGDWIHTGLNVGCVEATVMSGRLAANAITGRPAGEGLVGYFP